MYKRINDCTTFNTSITDEEDMPGVSIVVPCRNEKDFIRPFIEAVSKQDYPHEKLEVIIAEGMSDDGTREILNELCRQNTNWHIRIVDNNEMIVPSGLNAAIRQAKYDIILRMDVHTEFPADYVKNCVEALIRTHAGNVGGPSSTKARRFMQEAIAVAYHSRFAIGGSSFHFQEVEGEVDSVPYGCWRKEVLLQVGLFDPEFVRNQDDELNFRLKKAGFKIWQCPKIRSWYYPRNNLTNLFKQYYQYGYWKVKIIRKHGRPASIWHLMPGAFVISCLVATVLTVFTPWHRALLYVLTPYLLFLIAGAAVSSVKYSWRYFGILPIVFSVYHTGYGCGFVVSLFNHLIGNTKLAKLTTNLTR